MNKLMKQLQFFAYIVTWQINFTYHLRLYLKEIRRIVLAEYVDDYGFSKKVMNTLFDTEIDDLEGDQIGERRLGSSSLVKNLGLTLLLIIVILAVVISLIILASFVIKKTGY